MDGVTSTPITCVYKKTYAHLTTTAPTPLPTSPIAANNEELSVQYSTDGSFWRDRDDYPPELCKLACALPPPSSLPPLTTAFQLVPPPKADFEDELMAAQYHHYFPPCVPTRLM